MTPKNADLGYLFKRVEKAIQDAYLEGWRACENSQGQPATERIEKPQQARDDGFDEAWAVYAHKVGKVPARRAWQRLSKADRSAALAALPTYVASTDPSGANGKRFRAHMATWLNARRWEDEAPVASVPLDVSSGPKIFTLD